MHSIYLFFSYYSVHYILCFQCIFFASCFVLIVLCMLFTACCSMHIFPIILIYAYYSMQHSICVVDYISFSLFRASCLRYPWALQAARSDHYLSVFFFSLKFGMGVNLQRRKKDSSWGKNRRLRPPPLIGAFLKIFLLGV